MYLVSGKKEECCACSACQQICHVDAISMKQDDEGFLYPVKNMDICVNCGNCEKVCAFAGNHKLKDPLEVKAGYVKDISQRQRSSSGGLFYVIASDIIARGGVVVGATLTADMQIHHKIVSTLDELETLRGSKYVQSAMNDCFRIIKQLLKEGKLVYFVGTGCQVDGLKSYLRKDYDNLLTSDLICHGVPSQDLFDKHIKYLEAKYKGKVVAYEFRNNRSWSGCESVVTSDSHAQKRHILPTYNLSPFLYSFMQGLTCRRSCYVCPYARPQRSGDITLADFWGAQQLFPTLTADYGVSMVLVNTSKGQEVLGRLNDKVNLCDSSLAIAVANNRNLVHPTMKPLLRNSVFQILEKHGYEYVARRYFRPRLYWLRRFKHWVKRIN